MTSEHSLLAQRVPRPSLRIFISSPRDVAAEREKAREVIAALQRHYGDEISLKAVLWEDLPLGADASFQQGIDLVLSREQGIDIAVFILWSRLGSPIGPMATRPDGSPYRSGTEREFDLMLEAHRQSGDEHRPAILAYVRHDDDGFRRSLQHLPAEPLRQAVQQQQLVEQFIAESFHDAQSRTNLRAYHTYPEPATFSTRLRVHLRELIDARLEGSAIREKRWEGDPYRAFDVFDLEHAEIFFGREPEVADLEALLRRREPCAFAVVVGASGSGKSSLVRAGLVSALVHYNFDAAVAEWRHAVLLPGACDGEPLMGLARILCADEALPELRQSGLTPDVLAGSLSRDPQSALQLALVPGFRRATDSRPGAVKLLLIVDQLEELYTDRRITTEARDVFYGVLHALASSGHASVVATLRGDFYGLAQQDRAFLELKGADGVLDLLPPQPSALRKMITEPARLAGLTWQRDEATGKSLDQILLDDATMHADALPLLEFALHEIYKRKRDRSLTVDSYRNDLEGLKGAVGSRAESAFLALPMDVQAALPRLLNELVTLNADHETRPAKQWAPYQHEDATSPEGRLRSALLDARLLTANEINGQPAVALAHEALLTSWKRLSNWVVSNADSLRVRARVQVDYALWKEGEGKNASLLLPGGLRLEEARALRSKRCDILTEELSSYIQVSERHHDARKLRGLLVRCALFTVLALTSTFAVLSSIEAQNALAASQLVEASRLLAYGSPVADDVAEAVSLAARAAQSWRADLQERARTVLQFWLPRLRPIEDVLLDLEPGTLFFWRGKAYELGPERRPRLLSDYPASAARLTRDRTALAIFEATGWLRIMDSESRAESMRIDLRDSDLVEIVEPSNEAGLVFVLRTRTLSAGAARQYALTVDTRGKTWNELPDWPLENGSDVNSTLARGVDIRRCWAKEAADEMNDSQLSPCLLELPFPALIPEEQLWRTPSQPQSVQGESDGVWEAAIRNAAVDPFWIDLCSAHGISSSADSAAILSDVCFSPGFLWFGAVARIGDRIRVGVINAGHLFRGGAVALYISESAGQITKSRLFEGANEAGVFDGNRCAVLLINHPRGNEASVSFVDLNDLESFTPSEQPASARLPVSDSTTGEVAVLAEGNEIWIFAPTDNCRYVLARRLPAPIGARILGFSWLREGLSIVGADGLLLIIEPLTGKITERVRLPDSPFSDESKEIRGDDDLGFGSLSDISQMGGLLIKRDFKLPESATFADEIQLLSARGTPLTSRVSMGAILVGAGVARESEAWLDPVVDASGIMSLRTDEEVVAARNGTSEDVASRLLSDRTGLDDSSEPFRLSVLPGAERAAPPTQPAKPIPFARWFSALSRNLP